MVAAPAVEVLSGAAILPVSNGVVAHLSREYMLMRLQILDDLPRLYHTILCRHGKRGSAHIKRKSLLASVSSADDGTDYFRLKRSIEDSCVFASRTLLPSTKLTHIVWLSAPLNAL